MKAESDIRIAMDWLPNTCSHTGILLAHELGYFEEEGIRTPSLISPHCDGYTRTPVDRITDGSADLALVPSESIISSNDPSSSKTPLIALASILASDASSIVSLSLSRPRELDNREYASYGARFEGRLIKSLVQADGGLGSFNEDTEAGMLGAFDSVLQRKADATWIFSPWERQLAECKGFNTSELSEFKLEEYGIPYSYSPVIATSASIRYQKKDAVARVLHALSRGYKAAANADNAPQIAAAFKRATRELFPEQTEHLRPRETDGEDEIDAFLSKSVAHASQHILRDDGSWGVMDRSRFDRFVDFLDDKGFLTDAIPSRQPDGKSTFSLQYLRNEHCGNRLLKSDFSADKLIDNSFMLQE
jgi:ABC-type nitrate/sulfonate/bicarbonate transport system substrate-binding protein